MERRSFLAAMGLAPLAGALLARRPWKPAREDGPPTGGRRIPNVRVWTHEGRSAWFYDDLVKGKIVVLSFMYAACEKACPLTTANLVKVQKLLENRMGRDVFFYSITLRPGDDTPEVLRQYARQHGVGPGWLFLTGGYDDLERIRRTLGFVDPDPAVDADRSQHIGVILYGNETLERWAACPALTKPQLIAEYVGWMDGPKGVA